MIRKRVDRKIIILRAYVVLEGQGHSTEINLEKTTLKGALLIAQSFFIALGLAARTVEELYPIYQNLLNDFKRKHDVK